MSNMKSSRNTISVGFEHQNYILEKEEKGKWTFAVTRKYCKNKAQIGSEVFKLHSPVSIQTQLEPFEQISFCSKVLQKQICYLLIPDDFWKDLFMDKTLMAMVGPMSVLSLLGFIIPALLGILEYIKDRHIK